jgi:hypothetical protein
MDNKQLQVVDINDRFYWSLSQLQKAFGSSRETISKRLHAAGVLAAKQRKGHDVFYIGEAAQAILAVDIQAAGHVKDPDLLASKDRLDWYKGANEKNKFLREAGELVRRNDVLQEFAAVVKICVRILDTLPDILEMKCALHPDTISLIEAECDSARDNLAQKLSE